MSVSPESTTFLFHKAPLLNMLGSRSTLITRKAQRDLDVPDTAEYHSLDGVESRVLASFAYLPIPPTQIGDTQLNANL